MLEKKDLDLEKAVLVGIITKNQEIDQSKEYLDELEFLTYTAGGEVIKRFTQRMEIPNSKTFIGSGKMKELQEFIKEFNVGTSAFFALSIITLLIKKSHKRISNNIVVL